MNADGKPDTTPKPRRGSTFSRVLVGVDGTEPGFEACRQAAVLADPDAAIEVAAVVHLAEAVAAGSHAPRVAVRLEREADAALTRAAEVLGRDVVLRSLTGFVTAALLQEIERVGATVIMLGSHGRRRVTEILLGGVAGGILHQAPCAVLIARPPRVRNHFPHRIVVGVDGSSAGEAALAVAEQLATRLAAPLRILTALGGKGVDLAYVHRRSGSVEEADATPVEALVAASYEAGLVVVGSRGLHGLRALGSVSERVAHKGGCSVLVVRSAGGEYDPAG